MRYKILTIAVVAISLTPNCAFAQGLTPNEVEALKCVAEHKFVLDSAVPEVLPTSSYTYQALTRNSRGFDGFVDLSNQSAVAFAKSHIASLYRGMSAAKSKIDYFNRHVEIALACYPRVSAHPH
jgi:hypothetical protein